MGTDIYSAVAWKVHPDYSSGPESDVWYNDIALVKLNSTLDFADLGFEETVVNEPGVALRATYRHQHARAQVFGGIATADDSRNTQFTGNVIHAQALDPKFSEKFITPF